MELNITLTPEEAYAIQSIIIGLQGLTGSICRDYGVDNLQLLHKLEAATDQLLRTKYPV